MKFRNFTLCLLSTLVISGCKGGQEQPIDKPQEEPLPEYVDPPKYDEDSISFHYVREDKKYSTWALWLWADGMDGKEYLFNGEDELGAIAAYPLSDFGNNVTKLGFIVKSKGGWSKKDPDGDRFVEFSKYTKDENNIYHIYLKSGDRMIYTSEALDKEPNIISADFISDTKITVNATQPFSKVEILENKVLISEMDVNPSAKTATISFAGESKADLNNSYSVKVTFADGTIKENEVSITALYKTSSFDEAFAYNGDDLGVTYTKEKSIFKVWSPVSSRILLRIYESGTPKSVYSGTGNDTVYLEVEMVKGEKGVFEATVNEDLAGKYYTYVVTNSKFSNQEIVDPYAQSTGINGKRGMIVDFECEEAKPEGWDEVSPHVIDRKALTVYETHVADVTSSKTWNGNAANKAKFAGMYEEGTTYTENGVTVKTGFDHIKELGVNAVQLVPVFDQDNDEKGQTFNWGYNPLNYNTLEGMYSSDAKDGYKRIKEFRTLVQKYNEAGINIIMDVVYNHVSGASGSNFDVLMPGYYFRYTQDGALFNGSGCGNETSSELAMTRKFIKDSVCFLAKTYKLGGFRFDLMGLHDLDTMQYVNEEAKKIFDGIVIYGEPWTGGTSGLNSSLSAAQANGNKYVGYGAFNDQFRDALIKGGMNSGSSKGWITNATSKISDNDANKLVAGIKGMVKTDSMMISDPNKVVNYVTCHDNYTLYDRIKVSGTKDEETVRKMAMLANSLVFTSQGTTFMLAGEEFLRTKNGDSNSYQSSYATNELNYALKVKNLDIFENYKKLLKFKQNIDGMHLGAGSNQGINVYFEDNNSLLIYDIVDTENSKTYRVIHANGTIAANKTVDLSNFEVYLDTLNQDKVLSSQTSIAPYETIIAVK